MDTQAARKLYAELEGDIARTDIELARVRRLGAQLADHHQRQAKELGRAVGSPRGSALEETYLDHLRERWLAEALSRDVA